MDDYGLLRMLQVNLWWQDVASEVAEKVLERKIPQDAVAEIQEDLGLHGLATDQNWNLQVGLPINLSSQNLFRSWQHGWSRWDPGSHTILLSMMCPSVKHQ